MQNVPRAVISELRDRHFGYKAVSSLEILQYIEGEAELIDVIDQNDRRMFWIIVFNFLLYMYIMRRLWSEWELFIKLRHDFLSKGDKSFDQHPTCRRAFSHTVMVESVPR